MAVAASRIAGHSRMETSTPRSGEARTSTVFGGERPPWSAPYRLMMALRLLRARKVNIISVVGVMLGVASIIVVLSVMDGFQRDLRDMIRGTLSDLLVELDTRTTASYADLKRAVEAVDEVEAVALQKHTFGAFPTGGWTRDSEGSRQNYMPVRIVGIVLEDEEKVSRVVEHMRGGPAGGDQEPQHVPFTDVVLPDNPFEIEVPDQFVPEERPRVVLSRWIANRLRVGVGDSIPLLTFEETEEDGRAAYVTNDRLVIVSRVYSSGNSEFDQMHVYVDLKGTGQKFFPEGATVVRELRVKLKDYNQADRAREDVARALAPFNPEIAAAPRNYIETWEERQHTLLLAVNNEKFLLAFVLFFIVVVACFTIFATLTMTVIEKTREIGVLGALGATRGGILSIFLLNGTAVGMLGSALGYGLGMLVAYNVNPIRAFLRDTFGWDIFPPGIYLFDEIPTYIDHHAALMFALAAAGSALLFAIVPAFRAARLRPVQALRYE